MDIAQCLPAHILSYGRSSLTIESRSTKLADLNNQQVSQLRLLLRALLSASNKLSDMLQALPSHSKGNPELAKDWKRISYAITLLTQARLRLELSEKNLYDLAAAYLICEKHSEAEKTKEFGIIRSLYPEEPSLFRVGSTPWRAFEHSFTAAGVPYPLALQIFHAEFQREYHVVFNLRQTIAPVPCPAPVPAQTPPPRA